MDEKVKIDSTQLWTETDSTASKLQKQESAQKQGNWIATGGIILGLAILLVVLFNVRSN